MSAAAEQHPARFGDEAAVAAAAIAGSVEILQSHLEFVLDERVGALNADQRRFLDVAARHGRRLGRLVDDLETLALVETGGLDTDWAPCDLEALAGDAVREVWPAACVVRKPIEIVAPGPVWAVGDGPRVRRVVVELLELAVLSAAPESSIRVVVVPVGIQVAYEGDAPLEDALALSMARAVADMHGGTFSANEDDGSVLLSLSLLAE